MNCNDCCYNLPKDGHFYCTYEEGECIKISILKKKNAELDSQKNRNKYCYSCINATDRCFRNEIGCPCEKYKSYKEENAELKENFRICEKNADIYFDNFTRAKEIIENIIQVTWGEGWNYSLDWKVKAEKFLEENK